MSQLIKKEELSLQVLQDIGKELSIPKPFSQEIFLFDTYIAGTSHIEEIESIVETLQTEEKLYFFREPKNSFDERAIAIQTLGKIKIGYVPKADNIIFSRLMDAGKFLFAKVESKKKKGSWNQIAIKVFIKD